MQSHPSIRRVPVRPSGSPPTEYEVMVGAGLLQELSRLLPERCPAHHYVIIADERVAALYGADVELQVRETGKRTDLLTFPEGEANKTRESWAELTDRMLALGAGRDAAVIALGGGVTGDLAGFVAATYMRGLPVVQVPTTLLAMIDSSVGGKTGVDTPAGKNLVGSFLQPAFVLVDPVTLRTLAPAQLRSGMAEAVKHGAIADARYLAWMEESSAALLDLEGDALTELILRSVEIKAEVVSRDERESGPRKLLNFGHTLGHALEAISGYRLLHGEAVAVGMVLEARLGEEMGITEAGTGARLRDALGRFELPVAVPAELAGQAEDVLEATRADKKARGGRVEYALLDRAGAGRWGCGVEDEVVLRVLSV